MWKICIVKWSPLIVFAALLFFGIVPVVVVAGQVGNIAHPGGGHGSTCC